MRYLITLLISMSFLTVNAKHKNKDTVVIDQKMINELNPANFKLDFSHFDQNTALFCGQLSNIAYVENGAKLCKIEDTIRKRYPSFNIKFELLINPKSTTQIVFCSTNDFIVLGFKGTDFKNIKDLITDAKIMKYANIGSSSSHYGYLPAGAAGFRKRIRDLIDNDSIFYRIERIMTEHNKSRNAMPVYLTGHSLGAAMASLFVRPLENYNFNYSGSYHFAPPLAISCSDAISIKNQDSTRIYDIINYKDEIVKAFGKKSIVNHMKHIGKCYRFCKTDSLNRENEIIVAMSWWERKKSVKKMIEWHKIANYQQLLRNPLNTDALIEQRKNAGCHCFPGLPYNPLICY